MGWNPYTRKKKLEGRSDHPRIEKGNKIRRHKGWKHKKKTPKMTEAPAVTLIERIGIEGFLPKIELKIVTGNAAEKVEKSDKRYKVEGRYRRERQSWGLGRHIA